MKKKATKSAGPVMDIGISADDRVVVALTHLPNLTFVSDGLSLYPFT